MRGKEILDKVLYRSQLYLKHNASTILTCIGAAGVVGTSVIAVKATPKAIKLLDEAKEEKGEDLTKLEIIATVGPTYIPSIIVGLSTIACIFGSNILNKKQQAALTSAYMLLESSFKDYRNKAKELYGDDADDKIMEELAKEGYITPEISLYGEKRLFFEPISKRYFEATISDVQNAEYKFNRNFILRDFANINEFYQMLGLPKTDLGDIMGWSTYAGYSIYGYSWVDFTHKLFKMDDGMECYIIDYPFQPTIDFMDC